MHLAVDTLGHLLALHVTLADVGDRAAVGRLAADIQDATTGDSVRLAYVDQGYTGETAADAAAVEGIVLHVVKLPEAKRGCVAATTLGSGTIVCMGHTMPQAGQGLRAPRYNIRRLPRRRFHRVHAQGRRRTDAKGITPSNGAFIVIKAADKFNTKTTAPNQLWLSDYKRANIHT